MTARERALFLLAGKISPGLEFFAIAAEALALGTGCRWAGIGQLSEDGEQVRLLALWDGDRLVDTFTIPMRRAPFRIAYEAGPEDPHAFVPDAVAELFPDATPLAEMGARSYRAESFHDAEGRPLGHVFVIDDRPMEDSTGTREFFRLVSQRVGAEFNRWRAEEALALSEQTLRWFRRMTAATSEQMALIDRRYRYRVINSSYLRANWLRPHPAGKAWRREEIEGHHIAEVVGERLFDNTIKPNLDRCFSGTPVSFRTWVELPLGARRCIDAQYDPHRVEDGSIQGAVVVLRDVTDRRRHQAVIVELATHEKLVSGDLEAAAKLITATAAEALEVERVGLWLVDPEGRRLTCRNLFRRSTRSHGPGPDLAVEGCGEYLSALAGDRTIEAHEARADPRTRELVARHEGADIVSTLDSAVRVSGKLLGVLSHQQVAVPRVWQAFETAFAGEVADLVAQVIMNRDRRELERRLHQAQKMESLGVLAGGVAHDFNNLLVGILGGAELALTELREGSGAQRNVERVKRSAIRASELCNQMLAYAGKGHFTLERVKLSEEVANTVDLLRATLTEKAALSLELDAQLPPIEVDPTQLRRIIMNLITNASEALEGAAGDVIVRTGARRLRRRARRRGFVGGDPPPGQYVYLEVADSGCGMDEATRNRMFEPFFTTKFTGRGLGLAAVLGIVQSHRGAIEISSKRGAGTTIRIYLPRAPARKPRRKAAARRVEVRPGTLLLVDDEADVRQIAGEILERAGFTCLAAAEGRQGLRLLAEHPEIDLVILDLTMPCMNGRETFDEIRRRFRELPIILTSGFSADDAARRFADRDVAGFLPKPFEASQLLSLASEVLAARRRAAPDEPRPAS